MPNNQTAVLGIAILGSMVLGKSESGLDLITDRTQADVDRIVYLLAIGFENMTPDEQAEFLESSKGSYNYTDLNRVGNAVNYLAERFYAAGYKKIQPAKTDWTGNAEPTESDLLTYFDIIGKIRDKITVLESTPPVPSDMRFFRHEEANDIEKILVDVDLLLNNSQNSAFYSGDLYGGEI